MKRLLLGIIFTLTAVSSYAANRPDNIIKAAESGDAQAQFVLGEMYYLGENGVPQDFQKAGTLLWAAQNQGHADAAALLGLMNAKGEGQTRDLASAKSLFTTACDRGSSRGCEFLNVLENNKKPRR